MNVLLVNPPTLYRGSTLIEIDQTERDKNATMLPYYRRLLAMDTSPRNGFSTLTGEHLGLQSMQASLIMAGHQTSVLNACVELHTSLHQTLYKIREYTFDLIGFTGPLDVFTENLWLARELRESGYTGHITFGHDFATLNHKSILNLFVEFDSVIRGEGEQTIRNLANALEKKQPLYDIKSLTFRSGDGQVVVNSSAPAIRDLDQLPWVTRFDLPKVLNLKMSTAIYTKRGCPYQCSFCTTGAVSGLKHFQNLDRWRSRTAKNVVDEIEYLAKENHIRWFTIVDDLYLAKGHVGSQHALDVAENILGRQLNLEYMIDCRIDSIDEKVFRLLKRSGLRKVFVGAESSSEIALDKFKKGYKSNIVRKKLGILEELGIEIILGYIFFSPFDTLKGLEQNYRFILDLKQRDFNLFLQSARVYPGTSFHRDLEQQGLLIGEFPHFTALYTDPYVGKLAQMMENFSDTMLPMIRASALQGKKELVYSRDIIYSLLSSHLGDLIKYAQQGDESGLNSTYKKFMHELNLIIFQS